MHRPNLHSKRERFRNIMENNPLDATNAPPPQTVTAPTLVVDSARTQPINPAEREREKKLETLMMQAIRFFNAERGCLLSYTEPDTFQYEIGRNLLSQNIPEAGFVPSMTVIKVTLKTRKPQMIPDISAYDEFSKADSILMGKKRVIVCGPLMRNGNPIGVLYMDGQLPKARFTDNQLMLFTRLCDKAAEILEMLQR